MKPFPIRWETVSCPLCGSGDDREFLSGTEEDGIEYRLGQCRDCGMVFTNPRPDESSIALFYPDEYAPYRPSRSRPRGLLQKLADTLGLKRERALTDQIPVPSGGVLLDYGCGSGRFAAKMRDRGWTAIGMDFSSHAVSVAHQVYGLKTILGKLPHPEVKPNSLDVVTLRAVLEHVHDPGKLLGAVYDALRPGGLVYASVPNLESWGFRAFGRSWFPLDPHRHMLHFTPETLRQAVASSGFQVQSQDKRAHMKWIEFSLDRASRMGPRPWMRLLRARMIRRGLVQWTQWTDQAEDITILARKPETAPQARPMAA